MPVPRHWSQKRKYLQGKRGIEKPVFRLPEFIEATGIGEMRQAYHEKVSLSTCKAACLVVLLVRVWSVTICHACHWSPVPLLAGLKADSNQADGLVPCLIQEETKKLKSKQRSRMQPKMGKLDIDYQVLHDAFFKYQTKPQLTMMGDLYYEGKEFEAKVGLSSSPRHHPLPQFACKRRLSSPLQPAKA